MARHSGYDIALESTPGYLRWGKILDFFSILSYDESTRMIHRSIAEFELLAPSPTEHMLDIQSFGTIDTRTSSISYVEHYTLSKTTRFPILSVSCQGFS